MLDSNKILDILQKRHRRDLFLSEVKNGPTISSKSLIRLDAWAMKMSWKQQTVGYEIKISRSDFVSDQKWNQYLNYCNQFFWVCPTGLISKDEIDPRCGLIYVNEDGSHRVVKRALFRDVDIPSELYRYILMWRLQGNSQIATREDKIREYVDNKIDRYELGIGFKSKLLSEVNEKDRELHKLKRKMYGWEDIIGTYTPGMVKEAMDSNNSNVDVNALIYAKTLLEREIMRQQSQ